jgi:hypothetical protein
VLVIAAIALAGAWLAGCSTTVYKRGDRTADAAQAAAIQVQTESQALAGTLATLNNLVEKPGPDLKPPFQSFSAALDDLAAALKRGDVARNHLVRSNAVFLAAWDKQLTSITNTEVRSRSEARKTEVSNQFEATNSRYVQAQDALRSLIGFLEDIRKALSTDLTPGGTEAVKGLVGDANTTTTKVQAHLAQAMADLKALSTAMSSTGGPAAN